MDNWVVQRRPGRTSFLRQHGFSKAQRLLGEQFLAARTALQVYEVAAGVGERLDAVAVATALTRLAKLEADVSHPRFHSFLRGVTETV
mmetsp:Transcript_6634/g.12022  ORF Transcript_6634/g.12022 Transcript_6634/m.12022 type:complete len:88 (+) Transcript_6634:62-325(+)